MTRRPALRRMAAVPTRPAGAPARDLAAKDLSGTPSVVEVAVPGRWTLLLFLGAACEGCGPFWGAASDPLILGLRGGDRVVTLVRETDDAATLHALLTPLTSPLAPLVVSRSAWGAYGVHGPPFFALVDGSRVATEGVAWSVEQVAADVRRVRSA